MAPRLGWQVTRKGARGRCSSSVPMSRSHTSHVSTRISSGLRKSPVLRHPIVDIPLLTPAAMDGQWQRPRASRLCVRGTSPLLFMHLLERQTRCGRNDPQCRVIGIERQGQSVASLPDDYALSGGVALGYQLQNLFLLTLEVLLPLLRDARLVVRNEITGFRHRELVTPATGEEIERHGRSSSSGGRVPRRFLTARR